MASNPGCSRGTINTAVVAIHPWEDIATSLTPSFNLDAEGALGKVLPVTQQVKSSWTMDSSAAVEVDVLSMESLGGEGDKNPKTPNPSDANADIDPKLVLEHLTQTLQRDPFLLYGAATALYQEVEMLEQYVKAAAMKEGYVPYLVRLQIAVDTSRHVQKDAYVDISFRAISQVSGHDVEVVPLVASLNMESSAASVANRQLWSLALGLHVLGEAAGIDADKRRRIERTVSRIGQDLNDVMLVSRAAQGKISVKLSARNTSKRHREQTPQVHSVAVLVLVPTASASKPGARASKSEIKELEVATETYLVGNHGKKYDLRASNPMIVAMPPYSGAYVDRCGKPQNNIRFSKCEITEHLTITVDDQEFTAVVPGIYDANAAEMTAVLVARKSGEQEIDLRATRVSVDAMRRLSTFTFPAAYLSDPKVYTYELYVYHRGESWWSGGEQSSFPLRLTNVTVATKTAKPDPKPAATPVPKPALLLSTATKTVVRDDKARGEVELVFKNPPKVDPATFATLEVVIDRASFANIPKGVLEEDAEGRIIVKKAGRVVLPLVNLTSAFTITTREVGGDQVQHDRLEFMVSPL